jgi:hypothetical protein
MLSYSTTYVRQILSRLNQSFVGQVLVVCCILFAALVLFEVERNTLYRLFSGTGHDGSWRVGNYQITLSRPRASQIPAERGRHIQLLKIVVPFSNVQGGCEFLYGATSERYGTPAPEKVQSFIDAPRNLIRFAYDHKNLQCESKDLAIMHGATPDTLTIQLIDVTLTSSQVQEVPRPDGMRLKFSGGRITEVSSVPVKPSYPFISRSFSPRIERMSSMLPPDAVKVFFGPLDSFNGVLLNELKSVLKLCRIGRDCPKVRIAVSAIKESEIVTTLDQLHEAHCDIEVIINSGERSNYPGPYTTPYSIRFAPLFWNKGNRHLGPFKGILQMHTKFAVIGEDLVISSNMNLVSDTRYRSRGLTVAYRSSVVAKMFEALFVSLRTAVSYPQEVDRRDNFVLLVNAERPRRYVASAQRPYTAIRTEEGEVSNAYGILLDEIHRTPGKLSLFMSPITDSCFRYGRTLCFFEELRKKAEAQVLDLGLSGTFYLKPQSVAGTIPMWEVLNPVDPGTWTSSFRRILPLLLDFPSEVGAYTGRSNTYTVHHERFALLGEETLVAGSANFVMPFSVNTVEIIKIPEVFSSAALEVATYSDPFFVAPGGPALETFAPMEKNCLFFFEKRVDGQGRKTEEGVNHRYTAVQLLLELKKRGYEWKEEDLRLVLPDEAALHTISKRETFSVLPVAEYFTSPSSYMCVWNQSSSESAVVRVRPESP